MTKRRKARELSLQFLYETDGDLKDLGVRINSFYNEFASESLIRDGFKKDTSQIYDFFFDISQGTLLNVEKIDNIIRTVSKNWSIERMSRIDRNLLRLSVYEIMFHPETPKSVIINESVEIAKKFGNDESPPFINGILDAALKVAA